MPHKYTSTDSNRSHEIRNPLGAVVHCADSITDSLAEMRSLAETLKLTEHVSKLEHLFELIESSTDAVQTIASCTAHQKRIVDDILVLSKLDSNLLQISPSSILVHDVLNNVQKMFEAEAQRAGVSIGTQMDPSLEALNITYAFMDSGRILQILINLCTNAIKFSKNKDVREVTIRMGASRERPSEQELHVDFALSLSMRDSVYDMPEFADNAFYVWFTVHDTGRGMTAEEKSKIFSRFTQGSPKTYNEYGELRPAYSYTKTSSNLYGQVAPAWGCSSVVSLLVCKAARLVLPLKLARAQHLRFSSRRGTRILQKRDR